MDCGGVLGSWALLVRNLRAMGTEWSYCVEEASEDREGEEKSKPGLAQHDLKSSWQGHHLLLIHGSCFPPLPISPILPI